MNCEIPTRTKTSFQLHVLGYKKQELRQTALPSFENAEKSYLLIQHNTKPESGDQQSSISETLIAELVAPQLEQLWH